MKKILLTFGCVGCVCGAFASHIEETLSLDKGWNAIYIESTPDESGCEEFFRDLPVTAVAAYRGDADMSTAQYAEDGTEIQQKPVSYLQWIRGATVSTLNSIVGGTCYLVYATNAVEKTFLGVPSVPRMTWHKVSNSDTNDVVNLVGVSSTLATQTAASYFGEGPFGTVKAGQAVFGIQGEDLEKPLPKNLGAFGATPKVNPGKAYYLTATYSGEWPGVIGVVGSERVAFSSDKDLAVLTLRNFGTKDRTLSVKVVASALNTEVMPPLRRRLPRVDVFSPLQYTNIVDQTAWTVDLKAGASVNQVFALDRASLVDGKTYGAVVEVCDLSGTGMRLRAPLTVQSDTEETAANKYPYGLWVGAIALDSVSELTNATPVKAGGVMRLNIMVHNEKTGEGSETARLLQRIVAGTDTNGTIHLYRDLKDVPAAFESHKRFSVAFPGVSTPEVTADVDSEGFGKLLRFTWEMKAKARENPFRHAGHPDHDGLGTNGANEIWAVTNKLTLSWHQDDNVGKPVDFEYQPGEETQGYVTYEVDGLVAPRPITATGYFSLKRGLPVGKIEK